MDFLKPGDPRTMGPYVLSRRLGAGGMGEVFLGWSPGGRPVAVKRVYPRFANNPEFRRHFSLEVAAARKVGGFHTAQVVDDDAGADWPWMVTAYVAGPPLNRVLAGCGALPPDSGRVLGAGLAEALVAIHSAGIIHGDLKPANILLAADGPRVIDFGIARAIDASSMITRPGTPGFMAPEVLTKQPFTEACDIFALGVVLAYAGGIHPFGEGPPQAVDYQVVHEEPDLRGLDPRIRGLVAECLSKNPGDRPTAEQILGRLAVPDAEPRVASRVRSRPDRRLRAATRFRSGRRRLIGSFPAAGGGRAGCARAAGPVRARHRAAARGDGRLPDRPDSGHVPA